MMGASDRHGMATDLAHVARRHGGKGSPTDGWQDKSREVRPGRMAEESRNLQAP
jgi:hypothetical protein